METMRMAGVMEDVLLLRCALRPWITLSNNSRQLDTTIKAIENTGHHCHTEKTKNQRQCLQTQIITVTINSSYTIIMSSTMGMGWCKIESMRLETGPVTMNSWKLENFCIKMPSSGATVSCHLYFQHAIHTYMCSSQTRNSESIIIMIIF